MTVTRRNMTSPGTDQLSSRSETLTPVGRACTLLLHPVRRWAIIHAIRTGQVTTRDVKREFTYLSHDGAATNILRPALRHGLLQVRERQRGTSASHIYSLGDLTDLHLLRDLLNDLLPIPEVHHETLD